MRIRFSATPPDALAGSTLLVRLTAATHRLVDAMEGASAPIEDHHLELDPTITDGALASASRRFLLAVARLEPPRPLAALIADAATGHFAYRSLAKHGSGAMGPRVSLLAKVLLGAPCALVLARRAEALHAELADGETIAVPIDHERSALAAVFLAGRTQRLARRDLRLVAEQQLLSSLDSERVIVGSLGEMGLLAIGWPHDTEPDTSAMTALLNAAQDALAGDADKPADVDRIRRAVHEVNNPLGVIRNYLEVFAGRLSDEDAPAAEIRAMSRELDRIREILGRLSAGGEPVASDAVYTQCDLNGLVKEVVALIAPGAPSVRFKGRLDPSLTPLDLPTDICKQVLLILLRNAIEAIDDTEDPVVTVTTRAAVNVDGAGYTGMAVSDNRTGMDVASCSGPKRSRQKVTIAGWVYRSPSGCWPE